MGPLAVRGNSSDLYKVCSECVGRKLRRRNFYPRWGRCRAHGRFERTCPNCVELRDGHTRQPRCKACDKKRGKRRHCLRKLRRTIEMKNVPGVSIRMKNAATLTIYLSGNPFPFALLQELSQIAAGILEVKLRHRITQLEIMFTKSA